MDKLKAMFEMQETFMGRLRSVQPGFPASWPLDLTQKQSQLELKDVAFNVMGELFEAVQELKNSKKHRQTEVKEFDREHFKEECVDATKYLLELLIFVGITPDEFFEAYLKKDAVIHKRLDEKL